MGAFEDRIVASLVALQAGRTADDGAMFVLPTSLMSIPLGGGGLRLLEDGDVALVLPEAGGETDPERRRTFS